MESLRYSDAAVVGRGLEWINREWRHHLDNVGILVVPFVINDEKRKRTYRLAMRLLLRDDGVQMLECPTRDQEIPWRTLELVSGRLRRAMRASTCRKVKVIATRFSLNGSPMATDLTPADFGALFVALQELCKSRRAFDWKDTVEPDNVVLI